MTCHRHSWCWSFTTNKSKFANQCSPWLCYSRLLDSDWFNFIWRGQKCVFEAKLLKHQALITPAKVLRNKICVDLLLKIINHAFTSGRVSSKWSNDTIKPLLKGEDLRNPFNYRPLQCTIISIPCKNYANLLNKRLFNWLESNGLLQMSKMAFGRIGATRIISMLYTRWLITENKIKIIPGL